MAPSITQTALFLLGASLPAVHSNPLGATKSKLTGVCTSTRPGFCIARMTRGYASGYSSYCSSLMTTHVPTTLAATTTVTSTIPLVTETSDVYVSTDAVVTVTVCSGAQTTPTTPAAASSAPAKRAAAAQASSSPVPTELAACVPANIPAACSCLGFTRATVTDTSQLSDSTQLVTQTPATTTVTSTTTIITGTTTTTATIGAATPTVVLTSPTALTPVDANGIAQSNLDDSYYTVQLPFNVSLYGTSVNVVDVSINGWISLSHDTSSYSYYNTPLPVNPAGSYPFPDTVYAPYWNDLYIYSGTPQGLYYEIVGEVGSRNFSVEWYCSLYRNPNGYYHFIATLYENNPGTAAYSYYEVNGQADYWGHTGTIGAQSYHTGQYQQYSYNVAPTPGTLLFYDSVSGSIVDQTQTSCPNNNVQSHTVGTTNLAIPRPPKERYFTGP